MFGKEETSSLIRHSEMLERGFLILAGKDTICKSVRSWWCITHCWIARKVSGQDGVPDRHSLEVVFGNCHWAT